MPFNLALMAEVLARHGDAAAALACIAKALEIVEITGERYWEAELYRLSGEIRHEMGKQPGDEGDPVSDFERALVISRAQSARSLELRAATSLARLWHSQGKSAEARDLLAPLYGWFTEGFDTSDMKEAKALLDELS